MEYQPPQPPQSYNPSSSGSSGSHKTGMGLEPNIAAALSYVCGWVTGLVFYLMEKENNFVRFHAMQSIVTFGGLTALSIALNLVTNIPGLGLLWWIGTPVLSIVGFVLWIICLLKAYQGERFHVPIAGDIAEKNVH
jgi:uncharacterized membrane protein